MPGVSARDALAARQRAVLDDLLAGRTPAGFSAPGTTLTTRVLHHKRSSAALHAAPELRFWTGWRERFHAWSADHPQEGCAHDDVTAFAASLGDDAWVRVHEVYDGRRRLFVGRVAGHLLLVLGVGDSVWRLGGRPRSREGE